MAKLSVNDFRKLLREQVGKICSEHGWNSDNSTEKGYGFQTWLAGVVAGYEVGFEDTDPDDSLLYSRDLGVDFVMEDPNRQHILVCQAKYQGFDKSVDEKEVNDFFNRHYHLENRAWVVKNGSDRAAELLADYGEKIASGYSATFYFFSTGSATDRVNTVAETASSAYASQSLPVRCELFDFSRLKDYYLRSLSLEESGPREIVLRLPQGRFFEKPNPYPTVVAAIKGNELRRLYQTYKESLYVWNIRGYLGNRGINHDIFNTAESEADHFFYYNNGVSAICTNYEIRGENENEIWAENLQIINGAQTISTLAKATPDQDLDVLFRLTCAESVKTEKGFNRDIIRYNNTQNSIKVSDFRANDEIQLWLEERFKNCKATSVIPNLFYLRKRSVGRRGTGLGLKLEEMAKIRYSFLREPTLVHASPKSLWSLKEDDGVYEIAFGVDGELSPLWIDETFNEALLGVVLYFRMSDETNQLGKRKAELRYLRRLRFHALSLSGVFCREKGVAPRVVLHNKTAFEQLWQEFWSIASGILIDVHSTAVEQGMTMFAFVRSEERWEQMRKRLRLRLAVAAEKT